MEDRWRALAPTPAAAVDVAMQERLARLANRRAAVVPTARTNGSASSATTLATGRARRRHAAKKSRVAALAMSVSTTIGLSAYFYQLDVAAVAARAATTANAVSAGVVNVAIPSVAGSTPASAATVDAIATAGISPAAAVTAGATTNALKDGTYAGQTSNNRWGPVQVQITVGGGKVIDVRALQVPYDNGQSQQINDYAAPMLRSEALQAQSAKIDTVSGATYTSNSYKKSLQSAIDLARAQTAG